MCSGATDGCLIYWSKDNPVVYLLVRTSFPTLPDLVGFIRFICRLWMCATVTEEWGSRVEMMLVCSGCVDVQRCELV